MKYFACFRDQAHLNAYCASPSTSTPSHTWISKMDFTQEAKFVLLILAIAAAYYLGKEGFGIIKKIYSSIRNFFSGSKTSTPIAVQPTGAPVA